MFSLGFASIVFSILFLWPTGNIMAIAPTSHIQCYQCHGTNNPPDYRPLDAPVRDTNTGGFVGNHRTHMDSSATPKTCGRCHRGAERYATGHRDGDILLGHNLNESPLNALYGHSSSAFPQTTAPALVTCSNINCHFERETPPWGSPPLTAPDGCSACHGAPPAGGDSGRAGSHARHDAYFPGAGNCGVCHPDHLNAPNPFAHATSAARRPLALGLRDTRRIRFGSYSGDVSPNYLPKSRTRQTTGVCTTIYCHSNGASVATGTIQPNRTPKWGAEGPLGCDACHGNPPNYTSGSPKANSHAGHKAHGTTCDQCHYATTIDGVTISDRTKHVNRGYDLTPAPGVFFNYSFSRTGSSCSDISCHSTGNATWGSAGTTGFCEECHGHSKGYEYAPGKLGGGKGSWKSHASHTQPDGGNAKGPNIPCSGCHDVNNFPFFKSGTDVNSNGKISLAETDVCNTCHSPGGTYDGVNNAAFGAKANWKFSIYTGNALRSGKEKWCASCHDESPSVIQSVAAPNVIGDESAAYTYGTGWGFYKTGHGLPADKAYPSKDGFFPPLMVNGSTRAIECNSCHDFSSKHIDGVQRTYGTQAPTPIPSHYRQGYRLKVVDGKEPMKIPKKPNGNNTADDYILCFQCHNSTPFLDRIDEQSNMSQRSTGGASLKVGHYYHLAEIGHQGWKSDWRATSNSGVSCPQCHNVHGSKNMAMLSDGSLTGTAPGFEFFYYNRSISTKDTNGYNPPTPRNMPLRLADGFQWLPLSTNRVGCSATCHSQTLYRNFEWTPYNVPNQAPTLAWTGETNYTSDSVFPKSAISGSDFEFRTIYKDYQPDMSGNGFYNAPSFIRVMLDNNNDGVFETAYTMDYVSAAPSGGKIYRKIIPIRNTYSNTIRYKIEAGDGPDTVSTGSSPSGLKAVGAPTTESTIQIINRAPVLSWTNETHFESVGVNPEVGVAGSNFTFRVGYTDADAQPPDGSGVRVVVNGAEYPMNELPGFYYDTGKTYAASIPLTTAGTYIYRFVANDYFGAPATGEPTTDRVVTVLATATPPTLEWVAEPGRVDGVKPTGAAAGSEFEFRIKYTDLNNQWPPFTGYMRVWIDKNDNDIVDPGESFGMTEETAGAGSVSGKFYKASVRLDGAGDGVLKYRFLASNGVTEAVGEPTMDRYLTVTKSKIWSSLVDFGAAVKSGVSVNIGSKGPYVTLAAGPETWTKILDSGPGSSWGPFAYDSRCKKFIYYDGNTWEFTPALNQWQKISTALSPPATSNNNGNWNGSSKMTYDPVRDKVVMLTYNGQTWEYHSGVWTNRNARNINRPGANRYKYSMVYDSSISKVILVGGIIGSGVNYVYGSNPQYEETWTYDPVRNSWEPVLFNNTNPPASKGFSSSKMSQTEAVFDSYANKVIIPFGGGYWYNGSGTFSFSVSELLWNNLNKATPNRMYQVPLGYDPNKNRAILYGGTFNDTGQFETWVFNSYTTDWQLQNPANSPSTSSGYMDYDVDKKRMILNGGAGGTWSYGATYTSSQGSVSGLAVDAGEGKTARWNSISWNAFTPLGTSLKFQLRTSDSAVDLSNATFKGPDGTDQTFFTAPGQLSGFADSRFMEVKAYLATSDASSSPILYSTTIGYDILP